MLHKLIDKLSQLVDMQQPKHITQSLLLRTKRFPSHQQRHVLASLEHAVKIGQLWRKVDVVLDAVEETDQLEDIGVDLFFHLLLDELKRALSYRLQGCFEIYR